MMEIFGNVFNKRKVGKKMDFIDYFAVFTLVLVLVASVIFKSDFKNLADSRLVLAYCSGCETAGCGACSGAGVPYRCACSGWVDTYGYTTCGGVYDESCGPPTPTPTPPTYDCPSRCSSNYACMRAQPYQSSTADCNTPKGTVNYIPDCSCNFNEADVNCYSNPDCECDTCTGGVPGADDFCYAIVNNPPVFGGLVVKNNENTVVNVEDASNRNQICNVSDFNKSRLVTFEVIASDADGINNISSITLTWNGMNIPRLSNIGSVTVFGWNSSEIPSSFNSSSTYPLVVTITDNYGAVANTSGFSRSFKIWDCKIPISGMIYDAIGASLPLCPTNGFNNLSDRTILNFTSLGFYGDDDVEMTVNADGVSYTSGSNALTWGVNSYIPVFNDSISLSSKTIRVKRSSDSNWSCPSWYVDTTIIDPYSNSVSINADFSGILNQDPWWQTNDGGVISNNRISGRVPITCNVNCEIGVNSLVVAPEVENETIRSLENSQNWAYHNDTSIRLVNVNTNYNYFYNQFFVRKGMGTIFSGDKTINNISELGSDANFIYFINGDLTITGDIKNTNNFLMIIVNGDITVSQDVRQVDGILVANNIFAGGANDYQLVFNGSLFALNDIIFSRDHVNRAFNNSEAAVVVRYKPELIFNVPGEVTKVLTNWQWGN